MRRPFPHRAPAVQKASERHGHFRVVGVCRPAHRPRQQWDFTAIFCEELLQPSEGLKVAGCVWQVSSGCDAFGYTSDFTVSSRSV